MSGAAQIIEPELVEHDEEDVLLSGHMTMVFLRPQENVPEVPEIECYLMKLPDAFKTKIVADAGFIIT